MAKFDSKYLEQYKTDWTAGTSLVVTHNLNSEDVFVQIVNKNNSQLILVDTVEFTNSNTATFTASEAPTGAGWRVLLLKL